MSAFSKKSSLGNRMGSGSVLHRSGYRVPNRSSRLRRYTQQPLLSSPPSNGHLGLRRFLGHLLWRGELRAEALFDPGLRRATPSEDQEAGKTASTKGAAAYSRMMPRLAAIVTDCVRSLAPSLSMMCLTWTLTVSSGDEQPRSDFPIPTARCDLL